jgi:lysophospholipase L1-like esterase
MKTNLTKKNENEVKSSKKVFGKKVLFATNVIMILLMIAVLVQGDYAERIFKKIFLKESFNERYQQRVDLYSIYHAQKDIVMLGNSLTEGVNWEELMDRHDIAGRGIGGDITEGFIHRLNYVFVLKPRICFIEGGINDLYQGIAEETIINNLTILVDTLQQRNIKPVLSTVTYLATYHKRAGTLNPRIKELNKKIYQLAKEKEIPITDLNWNISDEKMVKDGVHFNSAAYLIWKEEVEKVLNQEGI